MWEIVKTKIGKVRKEGKIKRKERVTEKETKK